MATLTWGDVTIVGAVAGFGFTFLSYWASAWMSRHNVTGQLKGKPPVRKVAKETAPAGHEGSSKA